MVKRTIVVVMALLLIVSCVTACNQEGTTTQSQSTGQTTTTAQTTKTEQTTSAEPTETEFSFPLPEPITVKYMTWGIWNKTTAPFQDAEYVKWLEDMTNIHIEWEQMESSSQMNERQTLTLASGDLPDVMQLILRPDVSSAGEAGQLVDFTDYLDMMPNFMKYFTADYDYAQYLEPDGSIYQLHEMNFTKQPMGMMAYRKDLFDMHDLKYGTWEELAESLKTLKELYPDSTPVCNITSYGYTNMSWNYFGVLPGLYNHPYTNEIKFGLLDEPDRVKYVIEWYKKLWDDGLMHPDFFSMSTETTEEAWINGQAFWSSDQPDPFVWEAARVAEAEIDGAEITAMPYIKNDQGYYGYLDGGSSVAWWYSTAISAKSDYVEELIRFTDLGFTDEVRISQYYGIKGKSWDYDSDGKVMFINDYETNTEPLADLIGPFISKCLVGEHEKALNEVDQKRWAFFGQWEDHFTKYSTGIPTNFPDDVNEDIGIIDANIGPIIEQNVVAFITGTRPMSEWDAFLAEIKAADAEKLKQLHQDYYVDKIAVYEQVLAGAGSN